MRDHLFTLTPTNSNKDLNLITMHVSARISRQNCNDVYIFSNTDFSEILTKISAIAIFEFDAVE
jgi:hypothetical protein